MKRKTIFSLLVIGSVIVLILFYFGFCIYKTWYKNGIRYEGVELYETLAFTKYEGGQGAKDFFPSPDSINSFSKSFQYVDNRIKNNFFHKYCSYFNLDIYYDKENYALQKSSFRQIDEEESFMDFRYLYQEINNGEIKIIFYNDEKKMFRYLYLYGDVLKMDDDPNAILLWNATDCGWQQAE